MHASEVFLTPISTFEKTPNRQKIIALTGLQILSQVKHVRVGVELVKKAINQPVTKDQANLGFRASILKMKCNFQGGIMLPIFSNM